MGILPFFVGGVVHFALVLLDIAIALHLASLLWQRFSWRILAPLDRLGKPLVDKTTAAVRKWLRQHKESQLSERQLLAVTLMGLLVVRVIVVVLFNALIAS
jgi:hypothetical protein